MRNYILLLLILIVFHTLSTFAAFPFHRLDWTKPLLNGDYAFHFFQTRQTLDFLRISGRTWGYDPYFMAGYPTIAVNMLNNFFATFLAGVLSFFLPLPIAIKTVIIMMLITFPLIYFFSCRNFSFSVPQSLLASAVLIFLLHFYWFYRATIKDGLYNFAFCIFFTLFTFSCFVRYLERSEKRVIVYYTLSGWLSLTIHPLSGFILISFLFSYLIFNHRKIFSREFRHLVLGTCLIMAGNLYWLMPIIRFSKYYLSTHKFCQAWGFLDFLEKLCDYKNVVFNFFFGCSLLTPFFIKREDKKRSLILSIWIISLIMISIGSCKTEPIKSFFAHLQPSRYLLVSTILIPILAVQSFSDLAFFEKYARRLKWIILFFCTIILLHFFICSDCLTRLSGNRDCVLKKIFCLPLVKFQQITDDIMGNFGEGLVDKVLGLTDRSARVLIEDSDGGKAFHHSHMLGLLQMLTSREFIGGPYIEVKIIHSFAAFGNGKIFFKRIKDISIERFMRYMDLYNIKWVFAHSEESRCYFQAHPEYFQHIDAYRNIDIYSVNREASYFIEGKGNIQPSLDKIIITNASRGNIIIKYHFLETLKTSPMVSIREVKMLDDPVGFIGIDNSRGYDSIEIYN